MEKITITPINNTTLKPTTIEVEQKSEELCFNSKKFEADWLHIEGNRFHVLWENKSFKAEVVNIDYESKLFKIRVNHQLYEVQVKNKLDLLLESLGMDKAKSVKVNEIKAPMPGLIIAINVVVGQEVKKGETLLILEAMKMENIIKSPTDSKIKAIKVKKGENVEKNYVLLEFE